MNEDWNFLTVAVISFTCQEVIRNIWLAIMKSNVFLDRSKDVHVWEIERCRHRRQRTKSLEPWTTNIWL